MLVNGMLPLDITYNAGASDGTFLYSISGYSFSVGNTVTGVNRYNPATDTWDAMADIPLGVLGHVAVYYPTTNKIYVFGGEDAAGDNFNNTQIYDIATDSWTAGAPMPDVGSFMATGYVPSTGFIYIISGYNSGFIGSEQPRTWQYDPAADVWTDLTGTVPFPHPAGGMSYGVINNKVYITGGRDSTGNTINLTWEFDPSVPVYNAKANIPGTQPNQAAGAVALDALFVAGGGNPFLAAGTSAAAGRAPAASTKATSGTSKVTSGRNNTVRVSNKVAADFRRAAFSITASGRAGGKERVLIPDTTNHTFVYNPALDQWTTSADMNEVRSGFACGYISGSNQIMAAGGYNGFDLTDAEVLAPCIPAPTPTPTPCPPTPSPTPPCGLVIGDGLTIGFAPNGYQQIASNIVNFTFSSSASAPNDYAIFETHDPWGFTVVKDAITAAGHTYSVFGPCDLPGFDFSQYRVIVLNWDDTLTGAFLTLYSGALPALEAYSAAGGVVWVQGAIQSPDCYPLPFGGQSCQDFSPVDDIVNICNPMVANVPNPIVGNFASHVTSSGLPAAADVVVISESDSNPVLYDVTCQAAAPTPTPFPSPACDTGLIQNGGFERGNFTNWVIDGTQNAPVAATLWPFTGSYSAIVGGNYPLGLCGFGPSEPSGDSSLYQEFGPVPDGAFLSFWHWDCAGLFESVDYQAAYITDTSGNILQTIYSATANEECWLHSMVDLSPWVGQTIRVKFLVHQDGAGDLTVMFVDDVKVFVPGACVPTPTATPRPTPGPRGRPTPMPRLAPARR
jgi:N-acetylneuraminic acid mutarotase